MQHIGVDIIEIPRIEDAIARWGEKFLRRIYTDLELKLYRRKLPSLAARFAGKEAIMKVLGAGNKGIGWRDIEILSDSTGKPLVSLYNTAQKIASDLGLDGMTITISHSREYAIAFAVGEVR